jgi:hypothetical protein
MRSFNFYRPLMIILVALLASNITEFICLSLGMDPKSADTVGFIAMMIAAILTYVRLMKRKRS